MDAFANASPLTQRAKNLGARPMPLAAFELAEYRRPVWIKAGLAFLASAAVVFVAMVALTALVTP